MRTETSKTIPELSDAREMASLMLAANPALNGVMIVPAAWLSDSGQAWPKPEGIFGLVYCIGIDEPIVVNRHVDLITGGDD